MTCVRQLSKSIIFWSVMYILYLLTENHCSILISCEAVLLSVMLFHPSYVSFRIILHNGLPSPCEHGDARLSCLYLDKHSVNYPI